MPYQCSNTTCRHVFIHPAKVQSHTTPTVRNFPSTTSLTITENTTCPKCGNMEYLEYKEPVTIQNVLAHVQVSHSEVNNFLAQGYRIVDKYAKEVVMQKFGDKLTMIADVIQTFEATSITYPVDALLIWFKNAIVTIMDGQTPPVLPALDDVVETVASEA